MTFEEFLKEKQIPFMKEGGDVLVDDYLLVPYTIELKNIFPNFEFIWEYQRYHNEPNHVSG